MTKKKWQKPEVKEIKPSPVDFRDNMNDDERDKYIDFYRIIRDDYRAETGNRRIDINTTDRQRFVAWLEGRLYKAENNLDDTGKPHPMANLKKLIWLVLDTVAIPGFLGDPITITGKERKALESRIQQEFALDEPPYIEVCDSLLDILQQNGLE